MSHSRLPRSIASLMIAVLGCGGGDSPTGPSSNLTVGAQTEGTQADADGYTIQVGSGSPSPLAVNGSITISAVQAGPQTVTLGGIAPNCAVNGNNPATVQIRSGQSASLTFHIVCIATPGGSYRVALMTNRDPAASLEAWEINSINSDGATVALTSNAVFDAYPVWSPDGQKIVLTSDRDGPWNIYVMNQDGSNVIRLTTTGAPAQDRFPTWSPDGTRILFESNRTGSTEIYVMNADGSNVVRLTSNTAGDNAPHFSPDGSKIVFVTNRDAPSTQPPFGKWEVYVMNADGSSQTRLTNDASLAEFPSFLSASKILFDTDRSGPSNIFSINVDGSAETQLTQNPGTTYLAVGSPDEKHILFSTIGSTHGEAFIMNADGTGVAPITRAENGVVNVAYSYRK